MWKMHRIIQFKPKQKKIINATEAHAYLRSIYNDLSNNKKQGLYKYLEEEGTGNSPHYTFHLDLACNSSGE